MSDGGDSVDYRPPSDNLVDLHISIVPMEHWVERLNYASHKVIADTFSVGFIRVLPDTPLAKLRNDMRLQLGENFFPKSYVFLKHIGRCLALVRKSQEKQLKVKTFLPPQSIMPEIFVLPGQPNMYNYSVLPPITPKMQDLHKPFSEPESISPELVPETIYKQHTPTQQRFEDSDPVSESHESQQLVRHGSHKQKAIVDQLRRSMENDRHDSNKSVYRSQAASPPASKDIKRQKRHISGKSSLTGENPNKPIFPRGQRGRTTPGQASDAMSPFKHPEDHVLVERSQPSQAKSVLHEGPQKRKVHYNMPNRSSTNSSQGLESRGISQSSIVMEEKPPTNSTNNDSGYMEQDQSDSDDSTINKMKMRLLSGSTSDHKQEAQKQPQSEVFESSSMVQKEITHQASPSPIRIPKFHKPAVEQQEVVTTPASSPRPNESKSSSAKHEPPPQVSTVKQENETEKRLGSSDRAKLWSQLQNARNSRRLAEKERQDLVKQAKVTTSKLNQKRTSVRDMWKKKFFEEKKRTMPLEDICRRLQSELDTSHRRLVSALEGEKISEKRRYPTFLPSVTSRPSVKSNSKIQVTRLQHDIDGLRRKIEDAKIKLTGEIKLRHQAEEDVKIVRRELLTKKIRAHVAYREAIRGNGFTVRA
uniref:Spermatogenesis-associated protein 1 n=1 Tax=Phallusia mammillata TaxID=59560 RepID=A0A6F9DSU3_9ASCI|nr:spermatogenesis-associated protein 1 [Phallusia mammillata]